MSKQASLDHKTAFKPVAQLLLRLKIMDNV